MVTTTEAAACSSSSCITQPISRPISSLKKKRTQAAVYLGRRTHYTIDRILSRRKKKCSQGFQALKSHCGNKNGFLQIAHSLHNFLGSSIMNTNYYCTLNALKDLQQIAPIFSSARCEANFTWFTDSQGKKNIASMKTCPTVSSLPGSAETCYLGIDTICNLHRVIFSYLSLAVGLGTELCIFQGTDRMTSVLSSNGFR